MNAQILLALLIALVSVATAFKAVMPTSFRRLASSLKDGKPDSDDFNYSGVGSGGIEEGGFYSIGKKGHVPSIHEKAVVKLPDMRTVERGFSDRRLAQERANANYKEGDFTKEEDDLILQMVKESDGTRGLWVRIGKALNRHEQHCLYRYTQVLNADYKPEYKDIVNDNAGSHRRRSQNA
mmetsp:Transcript_19368/g.32848  ORF Transcript_19368/g.32848 Transcript_19368/m.32848 type:complete len:180 (+) Transcript_19368:92-631(+)|eukprot:CAMPEP_0174970376 /NCGR_PEP_ID=MMETSP0004_2-20121128/9341_1 /TAXON_ID=420556 /ORGANISM="Ochromonas sp., Strain CCMP1393" /LENGTH=179 /DNA_ID=CAMNT_0016220085 /DNA_START=41 /DNA_END=580 /DNA_ORIENTATION=+